VKHVWETVIYQLVSRVYHCGLTFHCCAATLFHFCTARPEMCGIVKTTFIAWTNLAWWMQLFTKYTVLEVMYAFLYAVVYTSVQMESLSLLYIDDLMISVCLSLSVSTQSVLSRWSSWLLSALYAVVYLSLQCLSSMTKLSNKKTFLIVVSGVEWNERVN